MATDMKYVHELSAAEARKECKRLGLVNPEGVTKPKLTLCVAMLSAYLQENSLSSVSYQFNVALPLATGMEQPLPSSDSDDSETEQWRFPDPALGSMGNAQNVVSGINGLINGVNQAGTSHMPVAPASLAPNSGVPFVSANGTPGVSTVTSPTTTLTGSVTNTSGGGPHLSLIHI